MKKRKKFNKKFILFALAIILIILIGFFAFKKFYPVKISLPIDTPEEAIEVVKQNRALIEEDLNLNNRSMNIISAKYVQTGSIYDTAYPVMVYKNAPSFLFWVSSCPEYIYVHVDKMDAKIKYIEFTTCSRKPLCRNFKCIVWNEIPPDELFNVSFCGLLHKENLKSICSRDRQRYIEKGVIVVNQT